jgi:flagellar biosynthesis GTPase FlhF
MCELQVRQERWGFPMGRGEFQKRLVALVAIWFLAWGFIVPMNASARDSDAMRRANDRSQEVARQQQERERERQERERERQERERERQEREQARQAREQAREQARQEREQARQEREQARRDREQARREPDEKSKPSQPAATPAAAPVKDDNASSDQGKAATAADPKATTAAADPAKADKAKAKVDPIDDDRQPNTVIEWFKDILQSAPPAKPVTPAAVAAPALKAVGPVVVVAPASKAVAAPVSKGPVAVVAPVLKAAAPGTAPIAGTAANANKGGTSKPVLTTGSTPAKAPAVVAQAAAPAASPAAAAKGQKPAAGRPVGRDGLPAFPVRPPEVLASNLTAKSIDRAVALGFQLNGTSRVSSADLNVTRLIAPSGMSADQARDLLSQTMPGGLFGVNQTYRIYRTATGVAAPVPADNVRAASPMATPCGTDRCFGPSIIHWQSSLQACSKGVKIGVIDTGYDASHPTFTTKVIESRRSVASDRAKSPDWHGTGVLALLAGDPNSGTPGLIPEAKFYVADIFYADAEGLPSSDTASLLNALDWLDKRNVNVINMSLSGPPDDLLKAAIEGLSNKKVIFVAAAGNDGPTAPPSYPAAYSSVVAVTAVSRDRKSYRYASRGDHIDVAAPGVDIWTASPGGRGAYHSGTSFAVPYVTAVLATAYKGLAVKSKAEFLRKASVLDLGEPGRDPIYGRGLLLAPASCAPEPEMVASAPIITSAAMPIKAQLDPPLGLTIQAKPR